MKWCVNNLDFGTTLASCLHNTCSLYRAETTCKEGKGLKKAHTKVRRAAKIRNLITNSLNYWYWEFSIQICPFFATKRPCAFVTRIAIASRKLKTQDWCFECLGTLDMTKDQYIITYERGSKRRYMPYVYINSYQTAMQIMLMPVKSRLNTNMCAHQSAVMREKYLLFAKLFSVTWMWASKFNGLTLAYLRNDTLHLSPDCTKILNQLVTGDRCLEMRRYFILKSYCMNKIDNIKYISSNNSAGKWWWVRAGS